MKSLRKTVLMASAFLLATPSAPVQAQQPQPGAISARTVQDPQSSPQENGGQTRSRLPVNQVIVPVTGKAGAGGLFPLPGPGRFRMLQDNVAPKIPLFPARAVPISTCGLTDT